MNKNGFFLAEETLKIVVAVICISFLIFILGKMYYSYSVDEEKQQAKDTLAHIEKEINSMKEGDVREIMVYSPRYSIVREQIDYWIFMGFDKANRPKYCVEKRWEGCLCVCKNIWVEALNGYEEKCEICASSDSTGLSKIRVDFKELPLALSVKKMDNQLIVKRG